MTVPREDLILDYTVRAKTLAVCCRHCGGLQGNYMVGEETLGKVVNGGIDALDTLAIAECRVQDWQYMVHGPSHSTMGTGA
jgi:hypothetical protein